MSKQSDFLSGFMFDRKDQRGRKSLMVRIALLGSLNFLTGCFFFVEPRDITLCLMGCTVCLLLAGTAHFLDALEVSAHSFLVLSFFSLAILIWRTGGINSPLIVWMPTIPIVALLLINLRWCMAWLVTIVFHHLGQFIAVQTSFINADIGAVTISQTNTLWTKLSLAIALMLALSWYEIKYRKKNVRLAARTHALGELQASLQQTRAQIDELVAALESQLRLPMQRVRLLAPITQLEVPAASVAEDDGCEVARRADQLLNLVEELGDLAKLESGQLALTHSKFDIHEAIENAVVMFKARSAYSEVAIQWAVDRPTHLWAVGDGARLSRVLVDLLTQSMDTEIGLTLQVNAAFNGELLVIDIPQARTVQTASQSRSSARENSEVLQIDKVRDAAELQKQRLRKKLVAMAGGRIVHVREAQEVAMRLEWPLRAVAESDVAQETKKAKLSQPLNVMLIGRQTSLQFEMQNALRQLFGACDFGMADSPETALVQLDFGNFNLILIDLQSPGIDAFALMHRIRTRAKTHVRQLIVIGLANAVLAPQRQHYLDAGMQWIIFRPCATDTLFRALSAPLS